MKVLITAGWVDRFVDGFRQEFPQVEFVFADTAEEIAAQAADAEIAFGPMSSSQLQAAPNLRWIQATSAGVEWMPNVPELAERGDYRLQYAGGARQDDCRAYDGHAGVPYAAVRTALQSATAARVGRPCRARGWWVWLV